MEITRTQRKIHSQLKLNSKSLHISENIDILHKVDVYYCVRGVKTEKTEEWWWWGEMEWDEEREFFSSSSSSNKQVEKSIFEMLRNRRWTLSYILLVVVPHRKLGTTFLLFLCLYFSLDMIVNPSPREEDEEEEENDRNDTRQDKTRHWSNLLI